MKIVIFFISLLYFGFLTAPGATWVNTDCDGFIYLTAAKFHTISHPVGAPLYNAINNAIIQIPIGNEFWRLAMVSAICSAITAVLLYLIATRFVSSWKALIAPAVFLASGLVVSQSTIVETYAMATLFAVLMYYLHLEGKSRLKYAVGGLGTAVHPITLFILLPVLISDWWNSGKNIKLVAKNAVFGLLYFPCLSYIFIANQEPFIWSSGNSLNDNLFYIFGGSYTLGRLTIIPTGDLICRLQDLGTLLLIGFSLSLILIIPGIITSVRNRNYLLPALFVMPILLYFSFQPPQTYVYIMPSFALGGILAIIGIKFYTKKITQTTITIVVLASSMGLMVYNTQVYDIGNNLDKKLAADEFYQGLKDIENDAVVWSSWRQWEGCAIALYNRENGTNIYSVGFPGKIADWENEDKIATEEFIDFCEAAAIGGKLYKSEVYSSRTKEARLYKMDLGEFRELPESDDYWRQRYCDFRLQICYIPPLGGNPIKNFYDICTGEVELTRWKCHTESSKSFMFLFNLIVIGGASGYFGSTVKDRRRKIIIFTLGAILLFLVAWFMTYIYQLTVG